jgi:hypothetical protein
MVEAEVVMAEDMGGEVKVMPEALDTEDLEVMVEVDGEVEEEL